MFFTWQARGPRPNSGGGINEGYREGERLWNLLGHSSDPWRPPFGTRLEPRFRTINGWTWSKDSFVSVGNLAIETDGRLMHVSCPYISMVVKSFVTHPRREELSAQSHTGFGDDPP
jgi:hypothetical protein